MQEKKLEAWMIFGAAALAGGAAPKEAARSADAMVVALVERAVKWRADDECAHEAYEAHTAGGAACADCGEYLAGVGS